MKVLQLIATKKTPWSAFRRVQIIHGCLLILMLACAGALSWAVWQQPGDDFETPATILYPYYRWIIPAGALGLCGYAASSPLVRRTLRVLKRQHSLAPAASDE